MAYATDDLTVSHSLAVGAGWPVLPLLLGPAKIRGSSYIEGPSIFGNAFTWGPLPWATVMIGPNTNLDSPPTFAPGCLCWGGPCINNPYSLAVQGSSGFYGNVDVAGNLVAGFNVIAQGEVVSRCGQHILSLKKNFDIKHPTRQGWRLRHTCPESPYNDVYIRGRINKDHIDLPEYWEGLVDHTTITVNLTPVGAHQDVVVKRIDRNKVYLQSKGNMPIDCFYHIYGERKDGEKLVPEYRGYSPEDYPGDNSEYSIVGWTYDQRESEEKKVENIKRA